MYSKIYLSFAQKLMKFEAHPHHYAIRLELLELNTFLIHLQFPFLVQWKLKMRNFCLYFFFHLRFSNICCRVSIMSVSVCSAHCSNITVQSILIILWRGHFCPQSADTCTNVFVLSPYELSSSAWTRKKIRWMRRKVKESSTPIGKQTHTGWTLFRLNQNFQIWLAKKCTSSITAEIEPVSLSQLFQQSCFSQLKGYCPVQTSLKE